jgi:hypothetical protein
MKSVVTRTLIAILALTLASAMAFAKEKKKNLTLNRDMVVNGTLIKKGDYKVIYNDQTSELTIMQGKDVVAKSTAHIENRIDKPIQDLIFSSKQDGGNSLTGIEFAGEKEAIVLGEGSVQAASPQR